MAIRTYKVTLDSKNSIAPEPVFLRQGDKTGAVVIDATLMDNGTPVSLDGLTPMFKANTADGQAVIADSTGFNIVNDSGGEFTYQVPNALSSVPGKITTAYFSLSDSSGSESTFDVAFIIKKAVDITKPQANDYITIIDGTLQSLQQKIDAMNTDVQTIIDNFNQGDFYNKQETESLISNVNDKVVFSNVAETNSGTEKEKIVSPQTLHRFNEDKNKTYFSIKSLSDLSSDIKSHVSEAFLIFKRTGNAVNFYGRVKTSDVINGGSDYQPLIPIPDGFKLSTEFNNMAWNVPIGVVAYQPPSTSINRAFAERQGTNFIHFVWSEAVNHYLSGSWYTDDDVPEWYQEENTRLSAHRGNTALAPENTLEAFQSAIDSNFGAVELDPRLSSDGQLFIMHDDTVDRTTDGTGKIEQLTAEQIKKLTIDTTNYSQYAGKTLRVPSLDESIKTLASGNMIVNIDGSKIDLSVKTTADAFVSILNKYNMFNRAFFVMSDATQRDAFISMHPDAVVSWLTTSSDDIPSGIDKAKTYKNAFQSIPLSIATEDNIEKIKESGLFFQVYGVNNTTDLARLKKDHVYLIETDGVS